jgi:hypothetical protein
MPTLTWTYVDAIAAVGDPIDYQAFDEIQSNVDAINAAIGQKGVSTFAGSPGRTITLAAAMPDALYTVVVTPTANPGGSLGEVWIEAVGVSSFRVHNSGSAGTAFQWRAMA